MTTSGKCTELIDSIRTELVHFPVISLDELPPESQMARYDSKFFFSSLIIPEILRQVSQKYLVLEVKHERFSEYRTLYFDTGDRKMFLRHHNGEGSRYKVRIREYLNTAAKFLEIKHKSNKGFLTKERIAIKSEKLSDPLKRSFIMDYSGYDSGKLEPVLSTYFTRITLLTKDKKERITLDCNLQFEANGCNILLPGTGVAEIKKEYMKSVSEFNTILSKYGVNENSMSKYCVGLTLLENNVKYNNFKPLVILLANLEGKFSGHPVSFENLIPSVNRQQT